jgi:phosphohistidine phosphatase
MKLYVLRHGEAEPLAPSDAARRLTSRGEAEVRAVTQACAQRLAGLQRVVTSPYQRARQTAAELMRTLNFSGEFLVEAALTPAGDAGQVAALIDALGGEALLLVSHQPLVGELLRYLTDREDAGPMGTACLAALDITACARGGARLLWLERPPG